MDGLTELELLMETNRNVNAIKWSNIIIGGLTIGFKIGGE